MLRCRCDCRRPGRGREFRFQQGTRLDRWFADEKAKGLQDAASSATDFERRPGQVHGWEFVLLFLEMLLTAPAAHVVDRRAVIIFRVSNEQVGPEFGLAEGGADAEVGKDVAEGAADGTVKDLLEQILEFGEVAGIERIGDAVQPVVSPGWARGSLALLRRGRFRRLRCGCLRWVGCFDVGLRGVRLAAGAVRRDGEVAAAFGALQQDVVQRGGTQDAAADVEREE